MATSEFKIVDRFGRPIIRGGKAMEVGKTYRAQGPVKPGVRGIYTTARPAYWLKKAKSRDALARVLMVTTTAMVPHRRLPHEIRASRAVTVLGEVNPAFVESLTRASNDNAPPRKRGGER